MHIAHMLYMYTWLAQRRSLTMHIYLKHAVKYVCIGYGVDASKVRDLYSSDEPSLKGSEACKACMRGMSMTWFIAIAGAAGSNPH